MAFGDQNIVIGYNFLVPTVLPATTVTGFHPDNAFDYYEPLRPMKFDTSITRYTFNLGSNHAAVKAVVIRDTNATNLRIGFGTTAVDPFDSWDLKINSIKKDLRNNRSSIFEARDTATWTWGGMSESSQYFSVEPSGAKTDGATHFKISGIYLITTLTELTYGFQFPMSFTTEKFGVMTERPTGSKKFIDFNKAKVFSRLTLETTSNIQDSQTETGLEQVYKAFNSDHQKGVILWDSVPTNEIESVPVSKEVNHYTRYSKVYPVMFSTSIEVSYDRTYEVGNFRDLELEEIT
jgi:hypothetical protein